MSFKNPPTQEHLATLSVSALLLWALARARKAVEWLPTSASCLFMYGHDIQKLVALMEDSGAKMFRCNH